MTWVGWMRHAEKIEDLPAPLRGPGFTVSLIAVFIVAMLVLLAYGIERGSAAHHMHPTNRRKRSHGNACGGVHG